MNELALFAGVGGGILGTQEIGLRTVCAVELDWKRRCVLVQRQNQRIFRSAFGIWDDICSFNARPWRDVIRIVTGGFPCQAFSHAARGRNNAVNLWPEMRRVIRDCQPPFVFAENVTLQAIEQAGEDCIEDGYKAEILSLSAADLGADHIRRRYWLLAYANDKSELRSTLNAEASKLQGICEGLWETAPNLSRVADGVAGRNDRFESTGNGQVSIVAAAALWTLANAN